MKDDNLKKNPVFFGVIIRSHFDVSNRLEKAKERFNSSFS